MERQGDRIRIGCCTGHEWEVKSVAVVPNGKGKCRIALSEMYSHAKVRLSLLTLAVLPTAAAVVVVVVVVVCHCCFECCSWI